MTPFAVRKVPRNLCTSQGQPGSQPAGPSSSSPPSDDEPVIKPKSPASRSAVGSKPAGHVRSPAIQRLDPDHIGFGRSGEDQWEGRPATRSIGTITGRTTRTGPIRSSCAQTVRDLNRVGKPREVHAALIGYLENHSKLAEPWMYEALAAAIELNKGSAGDVKKGPLLRGRPRAADSQSQPPGQRRRSALVRGYLDASRSAPGRGDADWSRTAASRWSCRSSSPSKPRTPSEWPTSVEQLALARLARPGRVFPP